MKTQTSNRMAAFIALAVLMALPAMTKASSLEKVDFPTAVATIQAEVGRVAQPGPDLRDIDPNEGSGTEAGIAIVGQGSTVPVNNLFDSTGADALAQFLKAQEKTSATGGGR